MWAVLIDTKANAVDAIKCHHAAAEECVCKFWVLHTDNGEFTTAEFVVYCVHEGIQCHNSALHTPQQDDSSSAATRRW